jgi:hypothetical protein
MHYITLATKHEKKRWIAPHLTPLGYHLTETEEFDTDSLGMFSGEVVRSNSASEAALIKAKQGCLLGNSQLGLGSEGSFGGGPYPGLVNWNTELLCLYDQKKDSAIYAVASGPFSITKLELAQSSTLSSIENSMSRFAGQKWLLKHNSKVFKGLTPDELTQLIKSKKIKAGTIEPDLRAMNCPGRQQTIARAAADLAKRLSSHCPQCQSVNYVAKQALKGLICRVCSGPTLEFKAHIYHCETCGQREERSVDCKSADPTYCPYCNP